MKTTLETNVIIFSREIHKSGFLIMPDTIPHPDMSFRIIATENNAQWLFPFLARTAEIVPRIIIRRFVRKT